MWDAVRSYWVGPIMSSSSELGRLFSNERVTAGVQVDDRTAFGVAAFACAVWTISWDVASLPLILLKRLPNGGKVRFDTHGLYRLLHDQPNPETTAFIFRQALMIDALSTGNGYAEIVRDGAGRPVALWNMCASRVTVFRQNGQLWYRVANTTGGGDAIISADDVLHIKGPSASGVLGIGMVQAAREALGLSIAAEQYGATVFSNGAQMGGLITPGAGMTEPARKNLRESLQARHQGVQNAHKLFLLEQGMTFTPTTANARDAQLNELRLYQVREIARFFRIPVSLLGDLERSTFVNAEQQAQAYYTQCLRPWLENVEQELSSKLIASLERNQQLIEHVVEGFLRADVDKRGAFYAQMLQNGVFTINEVRERENLPPIEGGDRPRVPLNTESLTVVSPLARPAPGRADVLIAAQRDVLIDVFTRVLWREAERARKSAATPQKLRTWVNDFYDLQEDHLRKMLLPGVRAWLACIGGDLATVSTVIDAWIAAHLAESRRDLAHVLDGMDHHKHPDLPRRLERVLVRWEQDRAIRTVDHWMQHGVTATLPTSAITTPSRPVTVKTVAMHSKQWKVESEIGMSKLRPPALAKLERKIAQAMTQ